MAGDKPILHLVVVGFHHKKGYQVEYSYPPLVPEKPDDVSECPTGWKYLPTLALPDGSHNFAEDSVFFTLPNLTQPNSTVYGVSCYRQIPVEKLINRTADVTRSTVQKAVCAIVSIPLYGYIEVKLSLIAQAFFDQGDFSNIEIIKTAYEHLNVCLCENSIDSSPMKQIYVGLPVRDIILRWRHKVLILFKLILLQRKVVCFGSPVRPNCSLILSILSLHPDLLEHGLTEAACVQTSRPMSPMPDFTKTNDNEQHNNEEREDICEIEQEDSSYLERKVSVAETEKHKLSIFDNKETVRSSLDTGSDRRGLLPRDASVDTLANSLQPLCSIEPSAWGAPLPIFTSGNLCLPYLSLPYMDLLTDSAVTGYIIGTSNILFRQKRQIMDVLIDIDGTTIEACEPEIRRQLSLTTEDLRFIDFVVRHVQFPKEDAEGSEQWVRYQFRGYMLALLRTAVAAPEDSKDYQQFNASFLNAWKKTTGYQNWCSEMNDFNFENIPSGHPFAGTLSVGDMKLKIAQTMNSSESGRKINQAVNTTSKAVGGAISQAKGAFSNLWSAFTAPSVPTASVTPVTPTRSYIETKTSVTKTIAIEKIEIDSAEEEEEAVDFTIENNLNNVENVRRKSKESPLKEKGTASQSNVESKGIVEIGREAAVLDSNRQNEKVFTV